MNIPALIRVVVPAVVLTAGVSSASAQTADVRYERALAQEQAAREQAAPSVATLRAIATAYEAIPRRYPRSAYADNALWQAAGLLELAYEGGRNARDRDRAIALLQWLRKEYPSSSLKRSAEGKIAGLTPGARPPVPAAPPARSAATSERAALVTPAAAPEAAPRVAETGSAERRVALVRISRDVLPRGERITLQLSHEPFWSNQRLTGPDRLIVDLDDTSTPPGAAPAAGEQHGGVIRSLTVNARGAGGGTRLEIELLGRPRHSLFTLYDPYRLVIDIERETDAPAASAPQPTTIANGPAAAPRLIPAALPASRSAAPPAAAAERPTMERLPVAPVPAPPSITSRGDYSLARQLGLGVARIVIDPGHGGHDPGASANGVAEAELVLDVARRLEKILLEQPGFEVVLTRRTNEYVALEERTTIANRESADLFLSIHANSSPQAATRGVETFILNFASNPQAEAVAARENATSAKTMSMMPSLLQAIALNNKLDESREFGKAIQAALVKRLQLRDKAVRDLGVKQAPFVVLIGAAMPSVLAEISFLTNRTEASLLKQAAHRQRIAQGLADGILRYQSSLKKTGAIAAAVQPR